MSLNSSDNSLPRVTVIIAAWNYGRFIGQTLESVMAQTYSNWECIVVDDGSTDNTREVVEGYANRDSRIRYIYQTNQRAGVARNNGMRNSDGKYLQFLDADDLIEAQKIELQVKFLEQHPEVDIVYGSVRSFRGDDPSACLSETVGEEALWMPKFTGSGKEALMALIKLPLLIHAPLLRRRVGDSVIWFDEKLRACEDWLFWVRCALQNRRFHYQGIEGTLGFFRSHTTSACKDRELVDAETRLLRRELKKIITDPEGRRLNQQLAAEYEGNLGVNDIVSGKIARGIGQLLKAAAISPRLREKMKWFFCASVAPFAPKQRFEAMIASPMGDSIAIILRHRIHGES